MALGITLEGNNWKYAVLNFLIIFLSQFVYAAYDYLALETFPNPFEVYKMFINSLVATLAFYGINRITHKEDET